MSNQVIHFQNEQAFYDAIYAFTVKGLTFKAYDFEASMSNTYTIEFTGGY